MEDGEEEEEEEEEEEKEEEEGGRGALSGVLRGDTAALEVRLTAACFITVGGEWLTGWRLAGCSVPALSSSSVSSSITELPVPPLSMAGGAGGCGLLAARSWFLSEEISCSW